MSDRKHHGLFAHFDHKLSRAHHAHFSGKTLHVKGVSSGKLLDVSDVSKADGAKVHLWADTGADNQKWVFHAHDDGSFSLEAKHSGKFLDVSDVSKADGALVHQWAKTDADNQRWWVTPVAGGAFLLIEA